MVDSESHTENVLEESDEVLKHSITELDGIIAKLESAKEEQLESAKKDDGVAEEAKERASEARKEAREMEKKIKEIEETKKLFSERLA